jgi:hypothetical protein
MVIVRPRHALSAKYARSHVASARGTEDAEHACATSQAEAEIRFGGSSSDSSDTAVVADHERCSVQELFGSDYSE